LAPVAELPVREIVSAIHIVADLTLVLIVTTEKESV
jgi:acetoacetate decarboxylase